MGNIIILTLLAIFLTTTLNYLLSAIFITQGYNYNLGIDELIILLGEFLRFIIYLLILLLDLLSLIVLAIWV